MDIRRLGTRSIANLAYAYLITTAVEEAVGKAEQYAESQKRSLGRDERREVITQAVKDFDSDLELDLRRVPGVEPERVSRARDNVRAIAGLTAAFDQANVSPDD